MTEKMWNELTSCEQDEYTKIYKDHLRYTSSQVNANASILTNWLYGLNVTLFGSTIALVYNRVISNGFLIIIFLLASLSLNIISTLIEYYRFNHNFENVKNYFGRVKESSISISQALKELKEADWGYLKWVVGLKIAGYFLLGVSAIVFSIKV